MGVSLFSLHTCIFQGKTLEKEASSLSHVCHNFTFTCPYTHATFALLPTTFLSSPPKLFLFQTLPA